MHPFNLLRTRIIFAITFALITAEELSVGCYAEQASCSDNVQSRKFIVHAVKFDLGDRGAEIVVFKAMKTKSGDEFNRNVVAHDLQNVFNVLKGYWKSRPNGKNTDWIAHLLALPTRLSNNQVDVLVTISTVQKSTASAADGSDKKLDTVPQFSDLRKGVNHSHPFTIWRYGTPPLGSEWKYRMDATPEEPHCQLGKTKAERDRQLQNFLEQKTKCYPGYDSETNF